MYQRLIEAYIIYNMENTPVDLIDYLTKVLNYPMAEATIIYMQIFNVDED